MNKEFGGCGNLLATGCYTMLLALTVFGDQSMPIEISSVGTIENGLSIIICWLNSFLDVDISACITMRFTDNRFAQLMYSGLANTVGYAEIAATNGHLIVRYTHI